jgi:hypothetical protein
MNVIKGRGRTATLCLLLAAALVGQVADVSALDVGNVRQLSRGLMWTGFRNQGTQGGVYTRTDGRTAFRLTYPGLACGLMLNQAGPDFLEFWSIKTADWQDQKQESQNTSVGESVWVLTKTPAGAYGVSYSGVFNPTDDIRPMYYDIAKSPEATWGYDVKAPKHAAGAGKSMANWYPGAGPQTDPAEKGKPYEVMNWRFGQYPDAGKDNRPENALYSKWTTKNGITITRKGMAWSYQGFDDFIILELEFENTGDSDGDGAADVNGGAGYTLNDTYFAFANAFVISQGAPYQNQGIPGDRGGTRPNDDVYRYTGAPNYDGPAEYAPLKINYQYDGDSPDTFPEDTGEPIATTDTYFNITPGGWYEGQLLSYQYIGMAPLAYRDAGAAHVFNPSDRGKYVNPVGEQPASSRWWETYNIQAGRTDCPAINTHTEQEIYNAFTSAVQANPSKVGAWVNAQTYGPYNLAPGDKAKIVIAYVGGSGADAIPRTENPAYSVDMSSFARMNVPLEDAERLTRLQKGEAALVAHLKAAQFAYSNGYDIPDYPPDVDFSVFSNADAQNELTWSGTASEASPNPDYGTADLAGYRIYRSTWQEFGPWTLVGTVRKGTSGASWDYSGGTYKWRDTNAAAGFRYFYNVRAYTDPHSTWTNGTATMADLPAEVQAHLKAGLEGGYSADNQRTNQIFSPYQPPTAEGEQLAKQIRVVPNPFSLSTASYNYDSTLKIRFVGLPTKCRIRIYNFAGDLVGQIDHDNPNSGEDFWRHNERNYASLEVATGIYFYVVESFVPESAGKKARGTFYIIR